MRQNNDFPGKPESSNDLECFFITPIGGPGTPERVRSDWVKSLLIKPALPNNFQLIRADDIHSPGDITSQVIQHLKSAKLVIADLTDLNPNVFYELGVRHTLNLPTIHIIETNQLDKIPFDVRPQRTISYLIDTIQNAEQSMQQLKEQVDHVLSAKSKVDNPVAVALAITPQTGTDLSQQDANQIRIESLIVEIQKIKDDITKISHENKIFGDAANKYGRLITTDIHVEIIGDLSQTEEDEIRKAARVCEVAIIIFKQRGKIRIRATGTVDNLSKFERIAEESVL